ncbi:MAG: hypothetical protein CR986_10535 [Ignavibacteriae bacterium]|nr:MAG: hypothetical protein CR986_10535 [Ignavibacteriota bacterium]
MQLRKSKSVKQKKGKNLKAHTPPTSSAPLSKAGLLSSFDITFRINIFVLKKYEFNRVSKRHTGFPYTVTEKSEDFVNQIRKK